MGVKRGRKGDELRSNVGGLEEDAKWVREGMSTRGGGYLMREIRGVDSQGV